MTAPRSAAYDCRSCGTCCVVAQVIPVHVAERVPRYLTRSVRGVIGFASWEAEETRRMTCDGDRCIALRGEVGKGCRCAIYDRRPAVCRAFEPGGSACKEARVALGFAP